VVAGAQHFSTSDCAAAGQAKLSIDFVKGAGVNSELVHFFVVPYLAGTIM
jgi:hypothetical protein